MQKALSQNFKMYATSCETGEEAYNAIINQLEHQISESMSMLRVLNTPDVKNAFINNWVPDMATFNIEYGGD